MTISYSSSSDSEPKEKPEEKKFVQHYDDEGNKDGYDEDGNYWMYGQLPHSS